MSKVYFVLCHFLLVVFLCSIAVVANSQTATLTITNSKVNVLINSLTKYEDGVTYTNWTKLGVSMVGAVGDNWKLYCNTTDASIQGYGANTLALNSVCIDATTAMANTTDNGRLDLVQDPLTSELITSSAVIAADPLTGDVFITYEFGVDQSLTACSCPKNYLLGKTPDIYTVDIVFTLEIY